MLVYHEKLIYSFTNYSAVVCQLSIPIGGQGGNSLRGFQMETFNCYWTIFNHKKSFYALLQSNIVLDENVNLPSNQRIAYEEE